MPVSSTTICQAPLPHDFNCTLSSVRAPIVMLIWRLEILDRPVDPHDCAALLDDGGLCFGCCVHCDLLLIGAGFSPTGKVTTVRHNVAG